MAALGDDATVSEILVTSVPVPCSHLRPPTVYPQVSWLLHGWVARPPAPPSLPPARHAPPRRSWSRFLFSHRHTHKAHAHTPSAPLTRRLRRVHEPPSHRSSCDSSREWREEGCPPPARKSYPRTSHHGNSRARLWGRKQLLRKIVQICCLASGFVVRAHGYHRHIHHCKVFV